MEQVEAAQESYSQRGLEPFDVDTLLIPLQNLDEFKTDTLVKNAITEGTKFYILVQVRKCEEKHPDGVFLLLEPKYKKINGLW